jgi:hypothetical protein
VDILRSLLHPSWIPCGYALPCLLRLPVRGAGHRQRGDAFGFRSWQEGPHGLLLEPHHDEESILIPDHRARHARSSRAPLCCEVTHDVEVAGANAFVCSMRFVSAAWFDSSGCSSQSVRVLGFFAYPRKKV